MTRTLLHALTVCLLFAPSGAWAESISAYIGATVIDGTGGAPIEDAAIVLRGNRIAAVGPASGTAIPEGAQVVDVSGKWIIPGLIDAHVHFYLTASLYTRPDFIDLRTIRPYTDVIRRVERELDKTFARYIASGVTGAVDVGGPFANFEVRARARELDRAPRVAVAGPLLATVSPQSIPDDDKPIIAIESPEQARREVARQLEYDPDLIKIWFVHPRPDLGPDLAWVRAVIEASHAAGIPVVAHATQRRVARALVDAGVDILAHSIDDAPVDEPLLQAMREKNIVYTTTLVVHEGYEEVFSRNVSLSGIERRFGDPVSIESWQRLAALPRALVPPWIYKRPMAPLNPMMGKNLKRVHEAGVTVAAGSDAGNIGTLHGPAIHRELELMVTEGGLTPMAVIVAATRGSAEVLGRSDDVGTVEAGRLADFVVLDADPLADIRNTRHIHRVIKDGNIYDPNAIAETVLATD